MKCQHCGKKMQKRRGHVCTRFDNDRGIDGMGPCLRRTCTTCGQVWQRGDTRYNQDGTWRKKVTNGKLSEAVVKIDELRDIIRVNPT